MVRDVLARTSRVNFTLVVEERLQNALQTLGEQKFDVILLDLSLQDSNGFDTFAALYAHAAQIPILVLTGMDDERLAVRTIREGAQDYLIKGQIDPPYLARVIRNAVERHRTRQRLEQLALLDDLTGLYNRRGFYSLARQHLKLSQREGRNLLLIFADVDRLKQINDEYGHQEGDQALQAAATILANTFRASDVISRIGGDEFVVLAIDVNESAVNQIIARLEENIARYNARNAPYPLTMSWGVACFDSKSTKSLEELIAQADEDLYKDKNHKHI
jgi:diguanylate cyclase (GGDEF)-like protein